MKFKRIISTGLIICLAFIAAVAVGCDGTGKSKTIHARSIINDELLVLNVCPSNSRFSIYGYFHFDDDITEIKNIIEDQTYKGFTLELSLHDKYLFIQKNVDGKIYYYLIHKYYERDESRTRYYNIMGAEGAILPNGYGSLSCLILVPHHILSTWDGSYYQTEADTEYEITGTKEEFLSFYKNCFAYTVNEYDDYITVDVDQSITGLHTKNSFRIDFTEHDEALFASYSILQN